MTEPHDYTGTDNLEAMAEARRYNEFLLTLATNNLPRGAPCLDFGAGIGTFAAEVRQRGFEIVALDPEPRHITEMDVRGLQTLASLDSIPDGHFGGAFTFNVLEHIDDDQGCFDELWRVLAPGGKLIVFVPALPWLWTAMDTKVHHYRRYTRLEVIAKAMRAGFVVERAEYADSLGVLATLAYKVAGNRKGDISPRGVQAYDSLVFPVSRLLDRALKRVVGKNVLLIAIKGSSVGQRGQ